MGAENEASGPTASEIINVNDTEMQQIMQGPANANGTPFITFYFVSLSAHTSKIFCQNNHGSQMDPKILYLSYLHSQQKRKAIMTVKMT